MWPNPQEAAYLVTFTEEILNEIFIFFLQCYISRFSFGHGDVLLVWVRYMVKVKYIIYVLFFLMHDKLTW